MKKAILIHGAALMFATAIFYAPWLAQGSSAFLAPETLVYEKRDGTWYAALGRRVPRGTVTARYESEMRVETTGEECHRPSPGWATYEAGTDRAVWKVESWAIPCLEAERPVTVRHQWQVQFGPFLLRPVRLAISLP